MQAVKALRQEGCPNEQHKRKRHLADDQHAANAPVRSAGWTLLWFALDPADQIASRRLPQRSKSKDDAGEDGDSKRKSKHSTIDANRSDRRVQVPGNGAEQSIEPPKRKEQPGRGA